MGRQLAVQCQLLQHLLVPLEDLDGIPAQILIGHPSLNGLLNVGDGVLHAAGKHMGQLSYPVGFSHRDGLFGRRHAALPFQGRHLHH